MTIGEAWKEEVRCVAARCMFEPDGGCLSNIGNRDCGWMDASDQMVKKVVTPSVM